MPILESRGGVLGRASCDDGIRLRNAWAAYQIHRRSENQLVSSTWTPSFYGFDGHGNVRFLANTAGTLTDNYQFDAFGVPIYTSGNTSNPFRYSGERFDSNLNFYYLRARTGGPAFRSRCCNHNHGCPVLALSARAGTMLSKAYDLLDA